MGVTPSGSEIRPARAAPARDGAARPDTEIRSKFEEAMRRKRESPAQTESLAGGEGLMPFEQPALRQQVRSAADGGNDDGLAHGSANPAPAHSMPAATGSTAMGGSPAEIAQSHYAFQDRINLPSQISGSETQLTMTDQRSLASHATVRSDTGGGLSVEVQTRSDRDSDRQQQETLRSRLEARGHRVASIEMYRS